MNLFTPSGAICAGVILVAAGAGLTSCAGTMPGQLGHDLATLETCPEGQKVASLVLVDGTGTAKSEANDAISFDIIKSVARRTAICGGALRVGAFSSGSASTQEIYDGTLELHGATDIARIRVGLDDLVAEVMATVRENYAPAMESLPDNGTDVVGQYRLIAEYAAQLPSYSTQAIVITDGINNLGTSTESTLTKEQAESLADSLILPELGGVDLTVAGLGRVAGEPLPVGQVEGLVAFYDRLCKNAGASSCLSVTDWRGR